MRFLEGLFGILQATLDEAPKIFGAFHIVSVLLVIAATFILCKKFGRMSERSVRILSFAAWGLIAVLEIYKQVIYTVQLENGAFTSDYQWYAFPYQFCSSPIYVLPFIAALPEGRVRDCFIGFMGTFSLFAGLCVMVYPGDVFVETIGINIQTMIHHGLQVVLGVFYTVHYFGTRDKSKRRLFHIGAIGVFAVMVLVALLLNLTVHNALVSAGNDETFNMYFISPYHECTLPVLSLIDDLLPYPVFLMIYITGFAAAASIVYYAVLEIYNLIGKRRKANAA
jgi:hypothetical protein